MAGNAGEMKVKLDTSSLSGLPAMLEKGVMQAEGGAYAIVPRELYNLLLKIVDGVVGGMDEQPEPQQHGVPSWKPEPWDSQSFLADHAQAPAEEPLFPLVLHSLGPKKIWVIKTLRELYGFSLKEAKDLAETPDVLVWTYTDKAEAEEAMGRLANVKAYVAIYKKIGTKTLCEHVFIPAWVGANEEATEVKPAHKNAETGVVMYEGLAPPSPSEGEGHPLLDED